MAKQVGGRRYAQALFELAVQHDRTEQWAADVSRLAEAMEDADFNGFLKHAEVPLERKIGALEAVLPDIDPLVRNLGALLVTRGAVDLASDVAAGYNLLLDDRLGRQRIEVTSAVELEAGELDRIRQFATDLVRKEVVATTRVDQSILGGVIIQIGDQLLDGSARSKLEGLRKRLRTEAAAG